MSVKNYYHLRLNFLVFGVFAFFAAVLGRLYYIQYLNHDSYKAKAEVQQYTKITLPYKRGSIFDAKLRTLAISVDTKSAVVDPLYIEDFEKTAKELSEILNIDTRELWAKMIRNRDKRFCYVKRKISDTEYLNLRNADIPGVFFIDESLRTYPKNNLLSTVLGFVDIDNIGLEGLEKSRDSVLQGRPGYFICEKDGANTLLATTKSRLKDPVPGDSLVLTIDSVIQYITERELKKAYDKHKPISATAIVMDPKKGYILAMANLPNFDPNNVNASTPAERRNHTICDFYEPGSVFKPFILAGALQERLVNLSDKFFCENGLYVVGSRRLHDHDPYGWLTAKEVVVHSSNIGIAKIGKVMGIDKMYEYVRSFGFGEKTGIDFPGETAGIVRPFSLWTENYSGVSVSMGQEVCVTPLQLATAFCAFGNGGLLVEPKIVKYRLSGVDNSVVGDYSKPTYVRRVLSERVANSVLNDVLEDVVASGTGRNAKILEYTIGGKTGTAQKVNPDGTYSHSKYVGSFVCIAPVRDPKIVVLVMMDSPSENGYYGGTVSAPAAAEIVRSVLEYLKVEPNYALRANFSP